MESLSREIKLSLERSCPYSGEKEREKKRRKEGKEKFIVSIIQRKENCLANSPRKIVRVDRRLIWLCHTYSKIL